MHKTIFVCDQCQHETVATRHVQKIAIGTTTGFNQEWAEFCSWSCAAAYCQAKAAEECAKAATA